MQFKFSTFHLAILNTLLDLFKFLDRIFLVTLFTTPNYGNILEIIIPTSRMKINNVSNKEANEFY